MIRPVPNQPISFAATLTLGCACDGPMSYMAPSDELRFQVQYQQCGDAESLITSSWGSWTMDEAWAIIDGNACIAPGNAEMQLRYEGWAPTPGTAYRLVIDGVQLNGTFAVRVGGTEHIISGVSGYDLFFIAGTADYLTIVPLTDVSNGCVQFGLYVYELDADLEVRFMNGTEEIFAVNFEDDEEYFTFVNGGVNVAMPMSVTGIAPGECFTVVIEDLCDETAMESQWFRMVDSDDCTYIPIRACNDYDAMGFANPFSPRIRIPATLAHPKYDYTTSDERHSNGRNYRPYADREREMTVGTDVLNEDDHRFLSALPLFSHVYIGEDEYIVSSDTYEPAYSDVWSASGAVQFQVKPKEELLRNVQCGPELQGCAPEFDPICNEPNIQFSFADNEMSATLVSMAGFPVGTIRVTSGAYDSGELTFSGVPDTLTFGPFADGQELVIQVTNTALPACNWRGERTVPTFVCDRIGNSIYFVNNEAEVTMEITTNGGFSKIRAASDGTINSGNNGDGIITGPAGAQCIWPTDNLGLAAGVIQQLNLYYVTQMEFINVGSIWNFGIVDSSIPELDFTNFGSLTSLVINTLPNLSAIDITMRPLIVSIHFLNLPMVTSVDLSAQTAVSYLNIQDVALTTLDLSDMGALEIFIFTNLDIGTLDLSAQDSLLQLTGSNSAITTVLVHPSMALNQAYMTGCALDATSIDALCNACDASFPNGAINLSGGTNAAPTAASLANRNACAANGWVIVTN